MNKSFARYNYQNKTIVCSKQFLIVAGQFGTPEFHQLMDMRTKQPTFTIEEYKPERKTEKKSYGKLTYETMAKFIANHETDANTRTAMLAEFDTVQKISKTQKGAYSDLDMCIKELCGYIGCECANVNTQKDEIEIHAQQMYAEKEQSFAMLHPHLLIEWNYQKNGGIDPYAVSEYSKMHVWWLCPDCGKEWIASVMMKIAGLPVRRAAS